MLSFLMPALLVLLLSDDKKVHDALLGQVHFNRDHIDNRCRRSGTDAKDTNQGAHLQIVQLITCFLHGFNQQNV